MIIPKKLKKGDTIGVVAPSNPIIGENIEELEKAKKLKRFSKEMDIKSFFQKISFQMQMNIVQQQKKKQMI